MEAFEKQATVWQLNEDYRCSEITSKTRFVGIIGYGDSENIAIRVLNAAFSSMDKPIRCLPLLPGDLSKFPKMLEKMKINGLIVDPAYDGDLTSLTTSLDEFATSAGDGSGDVSGNVSGNWGATAVAAVTILPSASSSASSAIRRRVRGGAGSTRRSNRAGSGCRVRTAGYGPTRRGMRRATPADRR